MADSWDDRAVADSDDNHDMPGTGHATSTLTEADWSPHSATGASVYDFDDADDMTPHAGPHFVAPAVRDLLVEEVPSRRRAADTVAEERTGTRVGREATPLADESPRARRGWTRSAKAATVVGGMVVTACAVGALALVALPGDTEDFASFLPSSPTQSVTADSTTSASPPTADPLAAGCVPESTDRTFTTDAAGGRASAQQVIAELNYAYYVLRNGAAVAAVYDPALRMDPVALQAAIDGTPIGTTHCVTVTPGEYPGVSAVELTETRPGEPPTIIRQTIETKDVGGTFMITSVKQ